MSSGRSSPLAGALHWTFSACNASSTCAANTDSINEQLIELGGRQTRTPPKSDAGRRKVILPAFVVEELAQHLDDYVPVDPDAPLFAGARGGIPTRANWARTWNRARSAAGLPGEIHLHDLRHAGATLAAQSGATTKELMARLGHASPRAALIYQHAAEHRDQAIADRLDRLVRGDSTVPTTRTRDRCAMGVHRDTERRVDGPAARP